MSKSKTITVREHNEAMKFQRFQWAREDTRKLALEHAVSVRREHDAPAIIIKSAKEFESYLTGKKG